MFRLNLGLILRLAISLASKNQISKVSLLCPDQSLEPAFLRVIPYIGQKASQM